MEESKGLIELNDSIVNICKNSIKLIKTAKSLVAKSVNNIQIMTYYIIGMWIVEAQQKGHNRSEYGKSVIKNLSEALTNEFKQGFSVTNIERFRLFYLKYKDRISAPVVPKLEELKTAPLLPIFQDNEVFDLPWSHYLILMRIDNDQERMFYEIEAKNSNWSKRELQRQYNSSLYERLALSKDKEGLLRLSNEGITIETPQDIIKQPTVLEFLGIAEKEHYVESDLETAILDKLQKFLLEMGKGYLFEKRQKRFTFDEDDYYVDLVLYNRLLKCYVLVDLKTDKLTHNDLGQMQMYVNYYDRYEKKDHENPTIGILLCKEKKDALVELTLPEDSNIYATEYKLYLPEKEELKAKLKEWIKELEE